MALKQDYLQQMKDILHDEYDEFVASYDRPRYVGLRVNNLKISNQDFKKLYNHTLSPIPWCDNGFYYNQDDRPGKSVYHDMGLYYIQEPSAMTPVVYLEPNQDDIVLDLCSAPGGKATQIATLMDNKGLLIANEIVPSRCKILSENIERLGIKNTIVTNHSPETLEKLLPNFFTKILVDAPCSGEGMIVKNDNAMDEWSKENTKLCSMRASKILDSADKMLACDGKLVFSTCTFNTLENEHQIVNFLSNHPEYTLEQVHKFDGFSDGLRVSKDFDTTHCVRLFPHKIHGEGHFVAVFKKHGEQTKSKVATYKENCKVKNIYRAFEKENMKTTLNGKFTLFGSELYLMPDQSPSIENLKIERAGLDLGTIKKDRFEPSYSLALYLKSEDAIRSTVISKEDAEKYAMGNTIQKDIPNGWTLLTLDGYSFAWGKATNGVIKNHYPKHFRK